MIRWEYAIRKHNHDERQTDKIIAEQDLNKLGEEGWELVSVIHQNLTGGYHITTHPLILIFKRQKESSYR